MSDRRGSKRLRTKSHDSEPSTQEERFVSSFVFPRELVASNAALKAQVEYLAKEVAKLTKKIKLNALQGSDHEDDASTSSTNKAKTNDGSDFKVDVPTFEGKNDLDEFLEWLETVERVFDFKEVSDEKKVKIVALKFRKDASTWWTNTCTKWRRNHKEPVATWAKMKSLLEKKFLPAEYVRENFAKLQMLKQGSKSLEEYTREFQELLLSHSLGRNSKFMATAVDLGRELIRRKIKLAYGGGSVGLQGAVASTVFTNGGLVRGFIPGYIATRGVYGPTYGVEHTVSSNYYKYFEMNHAVEAFIILPRGVDNIEGLFTLISWDSEGLHNRPIGLLNIDGYFNNLIKFINDATRQNFMSLSQRKLFISSFFVDELLDKLEFAKAFPGPGASYDEFVNPERLDLELHL
ncbi:unnamed protein product [Cuscuta campestris]|uniref:cytokinin riboside 5'-monophosphate phosphoribohydrolase n=1 Tax=Cuscuta campestris TaxID=132261 RepID=A0A484MP23_9ASTE|nr:unnamed protein product [Cuscuta campestris]